MVDHGVEQLVHGLEVGAANVPVGLLAIHREGGEVDDHRAEELGDTGDGVCVDGTLGNGLHVSHCVTPSTRCSQLSTPSGDSATKLRQR